jgi:mRNA-degrading endonuclease toxin of MazEF toxin-antitoxin module
VSYPCFGRVVWAVVPDPQGRNPKCRPMVIITPTPDIQPDGIARAVAVSTRSDAAASEEVVVLPWDRRGVAVTQLRAPCVAVCSWVAAVPLAAIERYGGMVPPAAMVEIVEKVGRFAGP